MDMGRKFLLGLVAAPVLQRFVRSPKERPADKVACASETA
jgi:hypothetical protein